MKKLEISKKDLKHNISILKKLIKDNGKDDLGNQAEIIAVVKANGMGLGLVQISKLLVENGIKYLAVATVEEVVELRKANITNEIIMLTPTAMESEIKILIENKATLSIGSLEELEKIEKILEDKQVEINAHIKIDTGLARFGFLYDNDEIIDCFEKAKRVHITGAFTHFSKPLDEKWTRVQFDRFLESIAGIKSFGYNPGMLHVASTTAFLKYKDMYLNAVRVGSFIQGRVLKKGLGLKEIGIFKTNVAEIKTVPKGYTISYGNAYKTKKQSKIAIIPVGYIDGLNKKKVRDIFTFKENIISVLIEIKKIFKDNSIKVEIDKKEYKVIGRIGMYHSVVDITDSEIQVGDEVIIKIPPLEVNDNIKREYN